MNKNKKPELLSPAGNLDKLKYAFAFGADAVYAGVPKFSLRTRENEFRESSLIEGMEYTHAQGKKIYLTMNIFAHNVKVDSFIRELEKVAEWQPDGLIMADPGLINVALKRCPDIPIHLSTQANATNWTTVEFWRDMGVKRIILSRELQIKEIAEIYKNVPDIELEAFVHGAICIAYSGRCLITNYMNHRDANQGTCTNSCRWEYKLGSDTNSMLDVEGQQQSLYEGKPVREDLFVEEPARTGEQFPIKEDLHGTYLFNAKDLCAIELLNELHQAGIMSFKIEGRTKSEYYAGMSARSYRKAIDDFADGKEFDTQNLKDLVALSNRSYTTGFYTRNPREYGENFQDARSKELTHKAVGMNLKFDAKLGELSFELKNRLEKGTSIDIISPDGVRTHLVTDLIDSKGRPADVVHGGTGRTTIPLDFDPGEFAIIRRGLYPQELAVVLD